MQDKLWEAIISRPEIEENERDDVYKYLKDFSFEKLTDLMIELGYDEKHMVDSVIKLRYKLGDVSGCLNKIKFYDQ